MLLSSGFAPPPRLVMGGGVKEKSGVGGGGEHGPGSGGLRWAGCSGLLRASHIACTGVVGRAVSTREP